ncbi:MULTISPECIES: TonB-dependent receptor plug domain-containing protein [Pasteurellaceae]|uniref:TonB-dependent receptor n=1 Tax=Pasteurella atlantica TaxID=2827233 RepID=A0AAW8CIZ6_9PAST|nr:TonB-dependent receptor [Pasteurella atlantica]MDP8039945.1 TonB-dependent receptor [Pasteurella atlantica]MDP8042021.1 TonB-dependent receptor [Pasteurella atlantica]MDP8044206.1 TonB-dependent receptor [Pasteurella atlantica]MDP8046229.1 TonB-dependent receptor [Pasteurella atlantica]MDP8062096.1 TonB-dependent receptor [Pasteurella atlantica]
MKKLHKSIILTSTVAVALPVYADNVEQSTINNQQLVENKLSEVVVYGQQNTGLSSTQKITSKEIAKTPVSNGNISDYLKSNSHIRFENSDETSLMRGEIKPAEISINGAEESQTSYYVDNVNINNDLGKAGEQIFDGSMAQYPNISNPQAYFFDANLLSSIVVHDSNVSASLGGFSGGAVVAKTKYYDGKDRVKLRYRTSRSQWAKFDVDSDLADRFSKATPVGFVAEFQPKYDKNFFSLSAEKSLTDNLGVVFGVSRRTANIQQAKIMSVDKKTGNISYGNENNTRRSDNLLTNFNYRLSDNDRFELGLRYSNYKESKYLADIFNSDVDDYHKAYGATFAWVHGFNKGVLTSTLAYDYFSDKRESSATHLDQTIYDGYEISKGGMGNSKLTQNNLHYSMEYAVNPFDLGNVSHSISVGGLYQSTHYKYNRKQDASASMKMIMDFGFGPFEMDMGSNNVFKGTVKTKYQNLSLYAEDLIKVGNFDFRPGIRIERDDFLKNTNIAPRFVANWSPLETTSMSLGLNRYYGRSFAAMKLAQGIFKLDNVSPNRYSDTKSFKTPYSDELSLGFNQQYKNVMFNAGFIHRKNKDRIVLSKNCVDGSDRCYVKGDDYGVNVYTLQISNLDAWKLGKTYWNTSLGIDWLDVDALDYAQTDLNKPVILDGKSMSYGDMRRKINNNRENWTVRFGLDMTIPDYSIDWRNKLYIKAPIKGVNETNVDDVYTSFDYGTHVQWDTSVRWSPKFGKHSPYVKFDVLNVLNKTRKGMTSRGINNGFYTAGREFWLELGYEF